MFRPEHPNPQCKRENWRNLNGTWEFDFDFGRSGRARKLHEGGVLSKKIEVPFCPESQLSGIGYTDFIPAVWYRRTFSVSEAERSGRVLLHFGAVDYRTVVYVNGKEVGSHVGGYVSFTFDITDALTTGENTLTVYAEDETRDNLIPSGKQCMQYHSCGCSYTRTTGIWQTVWLEFVPTTHIASFRLYPDAENGTLRVVADLVGKGTFAVTASYNGNTVGACQKISNGGACDIEIPLTETHLWEVGCGRLYDLTLVYGDDTVKSYFGLRSLRYADGKFYLNGKSVFQRLVLDQGFYPDGIYTASSEEALVADIHLSMALGFNGARLHEKVFEPRFLYHCDQLGYLVWGEYPNWGVDISNPDSLMAMLPEWMEEVKRDFNHPAIVGWCPLNETWDFDGRQQCNEVLANIYRVTKAMDDTRPCIDTSGNYHVLTDIFDVHDYDQDPVSFREHYNLLMTENKLHDKFSERQHWNGKAPVFISEYGGIRWSVDGSGWGYGNTPKTEEEYKERFRGLADAILDNDRIFGLCYTQLYDVEQEQNGLYTYTREKKFEDMDFFRTVLSRKAAIED